MTAAHFLESRGPSWTRTGKLIAKAGRKGTSALSEEELHELTRLYPSVAVDVARARMYGLDSRTQDRINQLAISAHGLLYRRRHVRPFRAIWQFFSYDYPRLFRRLWPYVTLSVAIFLIGVLGAYASVRLRPSTAYLFVPRGLDISGGPAVTEQDISERYRRMPKPPMASAITANNISVAFSSFALGITGGIGTAYVILINAMMLGGFVGHFANYGLGHQCATFLVPHGVLEIFAILVSGGAGLRLGISLAIPGRTTRKASLRRGAKEAVLLVLGTIPMFIVAGVIESFVTPSYIAGGAKIAIGATVLGLFLAYLLLIGHSRAAESSSLHATGAAWI